MVLEKLALLAALLLPALGLLCHCGLSPPSSVDSAWARPHHSADASRHASLNICGARRLAEDAAILIARPHMQKGGVGYDTPRTGSERSQRFLPPFFFPPLAFFAIVPPKERELRLSVSQQVG